jgi:hypothetical protein
MGWNIVKKPDKSTIGRVALGIVTLGASESMYKNNAYVLENDQTRERRKVVASSKKELGRKVSKGQFSD